MHDVRAEQLQSVVSSYDSLFLELSHYCSRSENQLLGTVLNLLAVQECVLRASPPYKTQNIKRHARSIEELLRTGDIEDEGLAHGAGNLRRDEAFEFIERLQPEMLLFDTWINPTDSETTLIFQRIIATTIVSRWCDADSLYFNPSTVVDVCCDIYRVFDSEDAAHVAKLFSKGLNEPSLLKRQVKSKGQSSFNGA